MSKQINLLHRIYLTYLPPVPSRKVMMTCGSCSRMARTPYSRFIHVDFTTACKASTNVTLSSLMWELRNREAK